jgi:hypothetical protein
MASTEARIEACKCPSLESESILDQVKQRGQSSSVNKVSGSSEGEGDELRGP